MAQKLKELEDQVAGIEIEKDRVRAQTLERVRRYRARKAKVTNAMVP